MRTRTAGFSADLGLVAAMGILALGLWIALAAVTSGRALTPSQPGTAPLQENPTTQPAPTNAAPEPPPSAAPANTNDKPPAAPAAPDPARTGSDTPPTGPAQVGPKAPKFDEPIDPPITNVKPIYIGEDK